MRREDDVGKNIREVIFGVEDGAIGNLGLVVGDTTAEEIKIKVGSALKLAKEEVMEVSGRDMVLGLPKTVKVTSSDVTEAIKLPLSQIINAVKGVLEDTPPELVSDIMNRGIVLCGGSCQLAGFDKLVAETIKMPVWVADDPQTAVVRGCGKVLEDQSLLSRVRLTGGLR